MNSRTENKGFSRKQIGEAINNALVLCRTPTSYKGEIGEKRLVHLQNYMIELINPAFDHIDEGLLKPEELVFILTAGALFIQCSQINQDEKIPLGPEISRLFMKKLKKTSLPPIDVKCPECKARFSI